MFRAPQNKTIMTKNTKLKEYFQVGHLYEYEMNKFSQVIENGGFITRTYLLVKFYDDEYSGEKRMHFVDIEGKSEDRTFPYNKDLFEFLKKIS